ncbi:MAG: type II secretion system GspH family protein [Fimbriimonadaceae bacterium]|nr:type II secretion system GspH family protein [Fimbriimonadaceae bacterium]MCZ7579943.1 type II secretion system GspH family protein [Fimbriimonadaceae bacterium]QOJ11631.1 MAG: type II secretion system protein [Chthonomonadaceae bacterium]
MKSRGFTLTEILIVVGILAILVALLFPVMQGVRASAKRTACTSNYHQANLAALLYIGDYDDHFPLVNHHPESIPDPVRDRTWVQSVLPYVRSLKMFRCPADYTRRSEIEAVFNGDVYAGDAFRLYYEATLRVNLGYNYLYLSPIVRVEGSWEVQPRAVSAIEDPSRTILFVDTVFSRTSSGLPDGGGSYVVIPPCRYSRVGFRVIDSFGLPPGTQVMAASRGWKPQDPTSPYQFGLAWPWHSDRLSIVRLGGAATVVTTTGLSAGCDVKAGWAGFIKDSNQYGWDLF